MGFFFGKFEIGIYFMEMAQEISLLHCLVPQGVEQSDEHGGSNGNLRTHYRYGCFQK